jgi:hypothetical protein
MPVATALRHDEKESLETRLPGVSFAPTKQVVEPQNPRTAFLLAGAFIPGALVLPA